MDAKKIMIKDFNISHSEEKKNQTKRSNHSSHNNQYSIKMLDYLLF